MTSCFKYQSCVFLFLLLLLTYFERTSLLSNTTLVAIKSKWSLSFSCFLTADVSCSKLPVKSDVASRGCIFSFCPGCRIPVHLGQSSTLLTWLAVQMKTSHWELVNTNGISGWLCCPASGWDWVDFFWICVSIYQLNYEYQCSHSDPALKHNKSQLCNNCALHLFCFPEAYCML